MPFCEEHGQVYGEGCECPVHQKERKEQEQLDEQKASDRKKK